MFLDIVLVVGERERERERNMHSVLKKKKKNARERESVCVCFVSIIFYSLYIMHNLEKEEGRRTKTQDQRLL
jgi:hypothetical protein